MSMTPDGRIHSQGSLSNVLAKDEELFTELVNETKAVKQAEEEIDLYDESEVKKSSDGKLVLAEEISEGHVGWKPCQCLLSLFMSSNLTTI